MPLRTNKQYRFSPPANHKSKEFTDFTSGLDTKHSQMQSLITVAKNVRFQVQSVFSKRKGTLQKGNTIGTASSILGLHSYVKKDLTAQLIASYNTDLYYYSDSGAGASTIATTTDSQGTGYSKDRNVFFTNNVDANGNPWLVVIYQNGSGIKLEWSASPYSSWANTVISVDASTSLGFSGQIMSTDDIHFVFESSANVVKYLKLTYSNAGTPTWAVGSASTVKGTGASDSAQRPSIAVTPDGSLYFSYRYYDGSVYQARAAYFASGSTTLLGETGLSTASSNTRHMPALYLTGSTGTDVVGVVYQVGETSATSYYGRIVSGFTWGSGASTLYSSTTATDSGFSIIYTTGQGLVLKTDDTNSSVGITVTSLGQNSSNGYRTFTVVNDGVNNNDIQFKDTMGGSDDVTATRVTNNSSNQLYPKSLSAKSSASNFKAVVFITGTSSPYNIQVNSALNWVAGGASLTAGAKVESCTMPSTAAGGTDQQYFVNGTDTPIKWDGSSPTSADASFPKAKWIFAMDNRLWLGGESGKENSARYTDLGSDNFSGTFPAGNRVDFPEATVWGHWYRDSLAVIFTRQALYVVQSYDYSGAAQGPESIRKIPDSYGTLSGRTVKQVGGWIYYQRPDGQIMRTNTQYAELVSDIAAPTLASIALPQLQNAAAGAFSYYYFLAITASGSAANDTMVVLDTRQAPQGGISIDTGKSASVFVTHPDRNNVPQIFFGVPTTTLGAVYQMEAGDSDSGSAIDMDLQTGIISFSGIYSSDMLRDILVVAAASGSYNLTVGVADAENNNAFANYLLDLDSEAGKWGQGVWDVSKTWGGRTYVIGQILGINKISNGFKIRFRNNAADQPVSIVSFAATAEEFKDVT